jgi:hypothetical protein
MHIHADTCELFSQSAGADRLAVQGAMLEAMMTAPETEVVKKWAGGFSGTNRKCFI